MLSLHIQNDYYGSNDRNHKAIKIEKQTNGGGGVFSYIAESLEMAVTDMDFDDFRANLCYSLGFSLVTQDGYFISRRLIHAPVINKFAIGKK